MIDPLPYVTPHGQEPRELDQAGKPTEMFSLMREKCLKEEP